MTDDRTPTDEQQDTTVDGDGTGQDATVAPTVTVPDAARILEVSTDAVRSRLRRGTLEGVKVAGEWHVTLDAHHDTRQDDRPSPTGQRQGIVGDQQDGDRTPTVVDLAPLTDLIDTLTRRNADLAATAAMWQTRAAHLEDHLKQLTAGEIVPATAQEAPGSTETNERSPTGVMAWLRRLL